MARKKATAASEGMMKPSRSGTKATLKTRSPTPPPLHNTRSQAKAAEKLEIAISSDDEDVEEIPHYPKYKDDLPNAFNGEVDPSKNYISKVPTEVIDNIISFLLLDHDPDRGLKVKERAWYARPHVLLSMAAMSRVFYHATEGLAKRMLLKHTELSPESLHGRPKDGKELRRSERISNKPQLEHHQVYRLELLQKLRWICIFCFRYAPNQAKFANSICICEGCELREYGATMVCLPTLPINQLCWCSLLTKSPRPLPKL